MSALLLLNLIIPFVMILVGSILKKHPQKDMTSGNGYNTPVSRKSLRHWDYAQSIAPDIFISHGKALGIIEIVLSAALFFLRMSIAWAIVIGMGVGFGFLLLGFYKTDSQIEENVG